MLKLFTNDPEFLARLAGKEACICPVLRIFSGSGDLGDVPRPKNLHLSC